MKHHLVHRSVAMAFAVALTLLVVLPQSAIAEKPKVDLAEAKAELAKAKAAQATKTESKAAAKEEVETKAAEVTRPESKAKEEAETKTPRKRLLFGRKDKKVEETQEDVPTQEEEAAPTTKVAEEKKERWSRPRLFGRNKEETPAKPEVEETEDDQRKSFLGSLFTKDSADKEPPAVETAIVKEEKPKEGGVLFGFFRGDSSEKFAKAEKTKLGKSLEITPKPSTGVVASKKSSAGELGWYVVTDSEAPFYAVGPGQPMPPEKILDRGSMLTVTKGGWGWCNVKLGSGELGVISSKVMRPASIAEISRHMSPVATASKSRGARKFFNILSRGPAPVLTLPSASAAPIRNFGLLPSISPSD
ncbi:MAG: hypothetical protein ACI9NC_005653 [Verrucomicrobiales bacterium]|jgi:hypothetical protein